MYGVWSVLGIMLECILASEVLALCHCLTTSLCLHQLCGPQRHRVGLFTSTLFRLRLITLNTPYHGQFVYTLTPLCLYNPIRPPCSLTLLIAVLCSVHSFPWSPHSPVPPSPLTLSPDGWAEASVWVIWSELQHIVSLEKKILESEYPPDQKVLIPPICGEPITLLQSCNSLVAWKPNPTWNVLRA